MKVRKGFVSNSSSTSFICDVCGENASGMDMGLEDADMYECENGHTFCRAESIGNTIVGEDGEKIIAEKTFVIGDEEDASEVPEKNCPCCSFKAVSNYDLIDYLLKETGNTKEDVAKELKERFTTFKKFRDYLK